jgi:hypothetical protein
MFFLDLRDEFLTLSEETEFQWCWEYRKREAVRS